jgi:hypothetical protein
MGGCKTGRSTAVWAGGIKILLCKCNTYRIRNIIIPLPVNEEPAPLMTTIYRMLQQKGNEISGLHMK